MYTFFLMMRATPIYTLLPYTALFRSTITNATVTGLQTFDKVMTNSTENLASSMMSTVSTELEAMGTTLEAMSAKLIDTATSEIETLGATLTNTTIAGLQTFDKAMTNS